MLGGQYVRYAKYGIICEVRDIHGKAGAQIGEIESFSLDFDLSIPRSVTRLPKISLLAIF